MNWQPTIPVFVVKKLCVLFRNACESLSITGNSSDMAVWCIDMSSRRRGHLPPVRVLRPPVVLFRTAFNNVWRKAVVEFFYGVIDPMVHMITSRLEVNEDVGKIPSEKGGRLEGTSIRH